MKHIKRDFSLKAWVRAPGVDLGVGAENLTFSEYGHVAYQIKADDTCSNMVANILPTDTPLFCLIFEWLFYTGFTVHYHVLPNKLVCCYKLTLGSLRYGCYINF